MTFQILKSYKTDDEPNRLIILKGGEWYKEFCQSRHHSDYKNYEKITVYELCNLFEEHRIVIYFHGVKNDNPKELAQHQSYFLKNFISEYAPYDLFQSNIYKHIKQLENESKP